MKRPGRARRILLFLVLPLMVVLGWALWTPDLDRQTLESRYLASPNDLRTIDGVRLHVRDTGPRDAPALVMLHGFASSLHTWEPWARALDSSYRVVRFDLPGNGLSAPDPAGDYTDRRSIRLLRALLDSLGIPRATLVGNSMGGRIAWTFAAEAPERVDRLVLVSPDGFESPGFDYGRQPDMPAAMGLMRHALPRFMLKKSLESAYADRRTMTDSLARRYHELLLAPGARDAMLQRMRQTILVNPVPMLRRITAPTLLLWGEEDAMIPIRNADDYLRAIPDVRLVRLPGVGHLPFEEAPAGSLGPVREFLSEAERRKPRS